MPRKTTRKAAPKVDAAAIEAICVEYCLDDSQALRVHELRLKHKDGGLEPIEFIELGVLTLANRYEFEAALETGDTEVIAKAYPGLKPFYNQDGLGGKSFNDAYRSYFGLEEMPKDEFTSEIKKQQAAAVGAGVIHMTRSLNMALPEDHKRYQEALNDPPKRKAKTSGRNVLFG